MITARQHIPNFVEGFDANTATAETIEELLKTPWIARWAESYPDHEVTNEVISWPHGKAESHMETRNVKAQMFVRWSLSDGGGGTDRQLLMAEYNGGQNWWVVAYLTSDKPINLPAWDHGRYRVRLESGEEAVIEGTDVGSSCGGWIWLRDGRKLKDLNY